jgi:hypothetical protein
VCVTGAELFHGQRAHVAFFHRRKYADSHRRRLVERSAGEAVTHGAELSQRCLHQVVTVTKGKIHDCPSFVMAKHPR